MSIIDTITKDKNERSLYNMIVAFLKAGGDPSVSFVGKFLQKHKLTLSDIAPYRFPKDQLIASPMSQKIIDMFGGHIVPTDPMPIAALAPVMTVKERLAELEAEQNEIPLSAIPF